jgi:hypothetical protein
MLARSRTPRNRAVRRGTVAFETLLVVPLFLIVILGAVGLADLTLAEQRLDEASGRAARLAACGGSPDQIRACVCAVLGEERGRRAKIYVGPVGRAKSDNDRQHESDEHRQSENKVDKDQHNAPEGQYDKGVGIEVHPVRSGELLEVRIELEAKSATATRLVPIRGSELLITRTVMQRE